MSSQDHSADVAIVGAGIMGLAHAYMALKKGYRVVLFERDAYAVGASIRNFGLVWPIGQQPGRGLERVLRSREHWIEIARQADCWIHENGSLHLAYHRDEWDVLNEFMTQYVPDAGYQVALYDATEVCAKSSFIRR